MAEDQGTVVGLRGGNATIKSHRNEACDSCQAKDGCRVMGGGKDMFFEVENILGAQVGDRVKVRVSDKAFLKAVFLVYIIPMIAFLLGAFLGNAYGQSHGCDPSKAAALSGFLLMAAVFAIVRYVGNRLGRTDRYKPRMVRIVGKADDLVEIPPMSCPPK